MIDFLKSRDIYKNIEEFRKKAPIKVDMNIENMNDIKLMTRNVLGKPYIQGSSIKGALVNFLLVDYIINNRNEFLKEKKEILSECRRANDDRSVKNLKNEIKKIISRIEKFIIYGDNKELEKSKKFGISISDSYNYYDTRTNFYQDIDEKRNAKTENEKNKTIPKV